jgi:hypothetical protein
MTSWAPRQRGLIAISLLTLAFVAVNLRFSVAHADLTVCRDVAYLDYQYLSGNHDSTGTVFSKKGNFLSGRFDLDATSHDFGFLPSNVSQNQYFVEIDVYEDADIARHIGGWTVYVHTC